MNEKIFFKIRLYFTAAVAVMIGALLGWNHYHGGVPSHHLLDNEQLPSVSNWWGALLLPLLSWFLLYRIQKRAFNTDNGYYTSPPLLVGELYGFLAALVFGMVLSTFFTLGYAEMPGYMILGLFPVAFFFPIYRAQYLLGFIIGMTFTFGAVLPTGFGFLVALVALLLYLYIRPVMMFAFSKIW